MEKLTEIKHGWLVGEKFCFNNKVKEISFKILHQIYPAKKTLERFKLDIEYVCDFCGLEDETISHLFYHLALTVKLFGMMFNTLCKRKQEE